MIMMIISNELLITWLSDDNLEGGCASDGATKWKCCNLRRGLLLCFTSMRVFILLLSLLCGFCPLSFLLLDMF